MKSQYIERIFELKFQKIQIQVQHIEKAYRNFNQET